MKNLCNAFILVLATSGVASAQYYGGYGDYPYGGGYRHASTVQEGAQRGFADVVRSAGYYNLKSAEARNIDQDTYSKYLDNRLKRTQTYFENRKLNKAYRAELDGPKPTQEQLIRYAQDGVPDRPKTTQLDPLTGQVVWPTALRDPIYDKPRSTIEMLFLERAGNHHQLSMNQYSAIQANADVLLAQLKDNVKAIPPNKYVEAKRFLEGLKYEAGYFSG